MGYDLERGEAEHGQEVRFRGDERSGVGYGVEEFIIRNRLGIPDRVLGISFPLFICLELPAQARGKIVGNVISEIQNPRDF